MPRLIRVFAGHTDTLLVLSCRGSNVLCIFNTNWMTMCDFEYRSWGEYIGGQYWIWTHRTTSGRYMVQRGTLLRLPQTKVAERLVYCSDRKFLDRYAWVNSADPDQTSPRGAVWSGSTLFTIPSSSFGLINLWQSHIVQILEWLQQIFWVSEYLGNLRCMSHIVWEPVFGVCDEVKTQTSLLSYRD